MHGEGHAGASGDVDSGWRASGTGQPPPHLPLHQRWRPRGQPPQHQPDPGPRRRGVSLHLQQLGRDRFLPGANKRKRCLSDQLFQHTITYTRQHVLIYSIFIRFLIGAWMCRCWNNAWLSLSISLNFWCSFRVFLLAQNRAHTVSCSSSSYHQSLVSALTFLMPRFLPNTCW